MSGKRRLGAGHGTRTGNGGRPSQRAGVSVGWYARRASTTLGGASELRARRDRDEDGGEEIDAEGPLTSVSVVDARGHGDRCCGSGSIGTAAAIETTADRCGDRRPGGGAKGTAAALMATGPARTELPQLPARPQLPNGEIDAQEAGQRAQLRL